MKPRSDCLSGGRYCAHSKKASIQGEEIVLQVLRNKCVEKVVKEQDKTHKIWEYFYHFNQNCAVNFDTKCINACLTKIGIKKEVKNCMIESFEKKDGLSDESKILLADNSILREEKEKFAPVQNFDHFPLLKINGIIYYGKLEFHEVFLFICRHVNDSLVGCKEIFGGKNNGEPPSSVRASFTLFIVILVFTLFFVLACQCKRRLRQRFEHEINIQVDQSINKFLQKTGGASL